MNNHFEISKMFKLDCVVCVWITFISSSRGTLIVLPQNTAVITGSQVKLLCTTNTSFPTWGWRSTNFQQPIVSGSCTLYNSSYSQIFGVDSTPSGGCNLIITSTPSESGGYTCSDGDVTAPNTGSAVLIVLDSRPICSIMNATNSTVFNSSSNILQMECHVSFSTYNSINPQLTWPQASLTLTPNATFAYSVLSTSLTIPETSSETCTLGFNQPTGLTQYYATNAPSFTSNCSTPVIYPLYCPVNISTNQLSNGTLTCTAQSNPAATYEWYGPVTSSKSTFEPPEAGNYTCVATNKELNCNSSSNITVNSAFTGSSATSTVSLFDIITTSVAGKSKSGDGGDVGGIVGGSIAAVVVIVAVVVVIFICFRRRFKNPEHSDSSTLKSSHSETNIVGLNENQAGLNGNQPKNAQKDGAVYGHIQLDAHVSGPKRRKPVQLLIESDDHTANDIYGIYAVIIRA